MWLYRHFFFFVKFQFSSSNFSFSSFFLDNWRSRRCVQTLELLILDSYPKGVERRYGWWLGEAIDLGKGGEREREREVKKEYLRICQFFVNKSRYLQYFTKKAAIFFHHYSLRWFSRSFIIISPRSRLVFNYLPFFIQYFIYIAYPRDLSLKSCFQSFV